jgi:hypothetical protein
MNFTQFNQVTWYSKLLAFMLFFGASAWACWLGFEYGKVVSETEMNIETASSSSPYVLCTATQTSDYKQKPDWTVFADKRSPLQVQYPPGWKLYPRMHEPDDLAPFFGADNLEIVKDGTSQVIKIAFFQNIENISAEELSGKLIQREFERQPGQPKFSIINKPYHIINCIQMIRRSDSERNIELLHATSIELLFKKDPYIVIITATKEVKEDEFFEILRTLKVGPVEDFPLWKQTAEEEMKSSLPDIDMAVPIISAPTSTDPLMPSGNMCPRICPIRASLKTDWCNGVISKEVKEACRCQPDCR